MPTIQCQEKTAHGKPTSCLRPPFRSCRRCGPVHSRSAVARTKARSRTTRPLQERIRERPTALFRICRASACPRIVGPLSSGGTNMTVGFPTAVGGPNAHQPGGGCKTPNSALNGWPPSLSGSHRTDPPQLLGEKCLTRYLANLFPQFCRGAHTRTNKVPSLLWRSLRDLNSRRVSSDIGLAIRPLTDSGKAAYVQFPE